MKNAIILISTLFLSLFLSSCSPSKRIQRLYTNHPELAPTNSIETIIETKDSIVYRDTTIYEKLPSDTVWEKQKAKIIYRNGKFNSDTLKASSIFANSMAWVKESHLNLKIWDKDTTLQIQLDNALKESYYWENKYTYDKQVITERYVPKFWKITGLIGIFCTLSLVWYIVLRIKKKLKI